MKKGWSRKNLWDALPWPLKGILGRALRLAPMPWLLGGDFRAWRRFLQDAQWWDAEQARAYQFARVREILTLAYERTIYYRRSFDSVGFQPGDFKRLEDLAGLPRIDRRTVAVNLHEMLTMPAGSRSVDYMTTSGAGGEPLAFYIGADRSAVEFAHLSQSWSRVGYRPGMKLAVLRGHSVPADRNGLHHRFDPLLNHHLYSSFHLAPEQMERYVAHMHRVRPNFLLAYPSSAYILGRFMHENSLEFPDSLRAALLESEPVYPHQREFLTRELRLRVFACYGHTEKLVLATECEQSSNYHAWPTYGYSEVLDAEGNPLPDGVEGEIVGTGFINRVVPFIRYRTDDYAIPLGRRCAACGRAHAIWADVRGHRSQEFLVCRNRNLVAWTALNMHDDTFDGIVEFQFVQDRPGQACLRLVPVNGDASYDLNRIRNHLGSKLKDQIDVEIQVCASIERTRVGKRKLVVQKIPNVDEMIRNGALSA